MSEERSEEHSEERSQINAEAPPAAAEPPPARQRGSRGAVAALLALLIVVLAGVALSPFWAPELAPLLPWGASPAISNEQYSALAARVAAIEQRPAAPSVNLEAIKSALNGLEQRVKQLETAINGRITVSASDVDALKSQVGGLAQRIDRLEAAGGGDRQLETAMAATKTSLQQLDQRVAEIEAQSAARKTSDAADMQKIQQELARLGTMTNDLTGRVGTLEHDQQSQKTDEPRTGAVLALLLAQMREAVEQARPFAAEYNAFTTLAHDPDLAVAARPLAEAARNGVASRAVLAKRLAELAGRIATASEPAAEPDLGQQVLAHLRGLVTIRRIDGSSQTGPEAAVSTAQSALARGDLAGAVAALDALSGANAEAARPWLQIARERLAVEAALDHLQELVTVRLGSAPPARPASPSPPAAPEESPEKARTPS
jgi:hypothetical protein